MSKDIKFNIRVNVDGKEVLVDARTNTKKFARALADAKTESDRTRDSLIKWGSLSVTFSNLYSGIQQLQGAMGTFVSAYNGATEAQTKLNTVMQQRMNASQGDVAAVNQVVAAQTQLGVIGGTVQRSGLQQLATFASQKSTLETLLPAMNNLLAQQKGLNATQEDAVSIGNLLGKALQGNYSALKRVGITFTNAQAQMIKYGDESQRAATIAQVITDNVGQMNQRLAETDAGKAKQLANEFGGLKVRIGQVLSQYQGLINAAGMAGMFVTGIVQMTSAVMSLWKALGIATIAQRAFAVATATWSGIGNAARAVVVALQINIAALGVASGITATAVDILKLSIRGLMIASGIGAVIAGVTWVIEKLMNASDGATASNRNMAGSMDEASAAANQLKQQVNDYSAQLQINIARTKNFKGTKAQEKKIVDELNNTYGSTIGYFGSVHQWYNALVKDSKAMCDQLLMEAEMRILANKAAKDELALEDLKAKRPKRKPLKFGHYTNTNRMQDVPDWRYPKNSAKDLEKASKDAVDKEQRAFDARVANAQRKVDATKRRIDALAKRMANMKMPVQGAATPPAYRAPKTTGGRSTTTPRRSTTHTSTTGKGGRSSNKLSLIADPKSKADYENNAKYYQHAIDICDKKDTERLKVLGQLKAASEQQSKNIEELADAKAAMSSSEVRSLKDVTDAISYYQEQYNLATSDAERARLQKQITELNGVKDAWDKAAKGAKDYEPPKDIGKLTTIGEVDKALQYYEEHQKTANADEYQNTLKIIDALNKKRDAITAGSKLEDNERELAELSKLSNEKLSIKFDDSGIDALEDKIKELRALLDDVQNPPSDKQRAQIKRQITLYGKLERRMSKSFSTMRKGYERVKDLGSGIDSISNAIKGEGNAWSKLTGIIDGALQVYDGITEVIRFVKSLTAARKAGAAADTAAAAATTLSNTATAGTAAAAATSTASAVVQTAANKAASASFMELAAAEYFAAHASIPFAGFGIAAGFAASAKAIVTAMGATPFAKGGVVSGPTLAMIGEYAGARNNPEVVAPLDKLSSMIGGVGNAPIYVEHRIHGSELDVIVTNSRRQRAKYGKMRP